MRFIHPTLVMLHLLFLGAAPALAAETNSVTATFMSLVDWQRNIIHEIARILVLLSDGASLIVLLSGTGLAFLYGALSELSSGHSKLVASAYFAGHPKNFFQGFWVSCQVGLFNSAATAILAVSSDLSLLRLFGDTPAHTIWLHLTAFAVFGAAGFFIALYTIRARLAGPEISATLAEQGPRLETYSHLALIGAMGLIPKGGAVLVLVFAFTNDIYGTGLLLSCAVSAGMALTIFLFSATGISAHRIALIVADESAPAARSIAAVLRLFSALAILILAVTFSVLLLIEKYS